MFQTTYRGINIIVKRGDITKVHKGAIVNPANSYGTMGGGVALAIRKKGGTKIEEEAVRQAPIPIGKAIITTAGKLDVDFVIHAPTMKEPIEQSSIDKVKSATYAAFQCAEEHGVKRIVFPGMGTGYGKLSKEIAAKTMISTIKQFIDQRTSLKEIILMGFDEVLTKEWKKALKKV